MAGSNNGILETEADPLRTSGAPRQQDDPFQGGSRFVFDSEQVPAPERVDMARILSGRLFGGFHLHPPKDPNFRASMWAARAGDVIFGSGSVTASDFKLGSARNRPPRQPLNSQDEEGIFWIYRKGSAAVKQGAVEGIRETGSAWFMHADVSGAGLTDGTHVLAISLPSKALRRAVGHNRHLEPVAVAKGDPLIQLLTGYVETAYSLPASADATLLGSIGTHLTELVALALSPTRDAAEQARQGGLKSARLDAVLRVIKENYANPEFSVADAASQLKLSVRYVQDILHETGAGFSERVLELRLKEAADLLSRAHVSSRKVSDIAFSCGFNNLSYFHRAFRRRFGMTPAGAKTE